jgi:hypothetical protein
MNGTTWFVLGSSVGFAAGVTLFALIFRKRALWGWGLVLALCTNIPTFLMLRTMGQGHDMALFILFGAIVALGLGGFGIGAVVGMIIVIVWGSPKSSDMPKMQSPSQCRDQAGPRQGDAGDPDHR